MKELFFALNSFTWGTHSLINFFQELNGKKTPVLEQIADIFKVVAGAGLWEGFDVVASILDKIAAMF